jgi:CheY-like chemotaxis protein
MPLSTELQLLLVSNDYSTLKILRSACAQLGAGLACMATTDAACDYVSRRKVDGIFLDLEMPDWAHVVDALRLGTSNHYAVVFACVTNRMAAKAARTLGAHVLLQMPLAVDDVVSSLQASRELMIRERRRYFRHQTYLPVSLIVNGSEQHALITNLSEGGMAVRVMQPLDSSSLVDFSFQLRSGPMITGRGNVAWRGSEGMVGIGFQFVRDEGRDMLLNWLESQERLMPQHSSWGDDPTPPLPTKTRC